MIETKKVEYKEEFITIKMRRVEEPVKDQFEFAQEQRSAFVAYVDGKATGLAYYTYPDGDGDTVYSLTHVPTGCSLIGNEYDMGSKEPMEHWIELCLAFADWTGDRPVISKLSTALKYATIGAREEA